MGLKQPAPYCPTPECKDRKMARFYVRGPHGFVPMGWRCGKCGWTINDKK